MDDRSCTVSSWVRNLETVRTMTSTGSPLAPEGFDFVYEHVKRDIHLASISGGTDIVSCFVGGNPIGPVWRGEIQCRALGMNVDVWDEQGRPVRPRCSRCRLTEGRPRCVTGGVERSSVRARAVSGPLSLLVVVGLLVVAASGCGEDRADPGPAVAFRFVGGGLVPARLPSVSTLRCRGRG